MNFHNNFDLIQAHTHNESWPNKKTSWHIHLTHLNQSFHVFISMFNLFWFLTHNNVVTFSIQMFTMCLIYAWYKLLCSSFWPLLVQTLSYILASIDLVIFFFLLRCRVNFHYKKLVYIYVIIVLQCVKTHSTFKIIKNSRDVHIIMVNHLKTATGILTNVTIVYA